MEIEYKEKGYAICLEPCREKKYITHQVNLCILVECLIKMGKLMEKIRHENYVRKIVCVACSVLCGTHDYCKKQKWSV